MSDTSSQQAQKKTTDYKAKAKTYYQKTKTLQTELEQTKTQMAENNSQAKRILEDCRKTAKTLHDKDQATIKELEGEVQHQKDKVAMSEVFIKSLQELTGKSSADEVFEWAEEKANQDQAEKTQQDALRMLGELQVKFNLLTEEMARIKEEGYKPPAKIAKKQKGLSGKHRKEDCAAGEMRAFDECRCSAISWANGLAQQCSRHWTSHGEDGTRTHLCKTHFKLLEVRNGKEVFTGSWGLYHQERPSVWGEFGLSVQKEFAKDGKGIGKKIPYKLKAEDYNKQIMNHMAAVPSKVPRFDYPEKSNIHYEEDPDFSDDDTDDMSVASSNTCPFSDEENDVANLADVETPSEEEVETEVVEVDEDPVVFAKQAQLDRLEQLNSGAINVDYDVLCDLREEKKAFEEADEETMTEEEAKGVESTEESEEDEQIVCVQCDKQMTKECAFYPCEPDEPWCHDCKVQEEHDMKGQSNCLLPSESDEESE